MDSKTELSKEDFELIEVAKETADRLHIDDVHEVAAAVRTKDKMVFSGIHFETDVDWANVCGEVAAICTPVPYGHREFEAMKEKSNSN